MPVVAFLLANSAVILAAWRLGSHGTSGANRPLRLLGTFASFAILVTLIMLLAGWLHWFRPLPMTGLAAGVFALVYFAVRGEGHAQAPVEIHKRTKANEAMWRTVGLALFAAFGSVLALRALTQGTSFFSDDFGYHAVAAVHWLKEGGFAPMPPEYVATYPYGTELFSLWFMLPFGDTTWAGLAGLFWASFAAVGIHQAARLSGASSSAAWLATALTFASTEFAFLVRTFSATDLACSVAIIASAVLSAQAVSAEKNGLRLGLLAGALAGIAVGGKVSMAPAAALLAGSLLFGRRALRSKLALVMAFVVAALATGGWWYLSNWINSGNPFFPAALGPFDGPFSKAGQRSTELLHAVTAEPHPISFWLKLAGSYLDWPIGLAILSILGFAAALFAESSRQSSLDPHTSTRRRLLVIGLVLGALHPLTPFSHGSGIANGELHPFLRYVLPSFMIGLVLVSRQFNPERRWGVVWSALAVVAMATAWPGPGKSVFVAFISAAVVVVAAHKERLKPLALAAGVAVLISVPLLTPRQREATRHNVYETGVADGMPIGAAWAALDRLPDGAVVASLSHLPYHRSPLFGSRAQLRPVFLHLDGTVRRPLHEEYKEHRDVVGISERPWANLTGDEWLARLRSAGVQYVLVSKWRLADWPPPYEPLRSTGAFEPIFDDGYSVIWKINP